MYWKKKSYDLNNSFYDIQIELNAWMNGQYFTRAEDCWESGLALYTDGFFKSQEFQRTSLTWVAAYEYELHSERDIEMWSLQLLLSDLMTIAGI